MYLCILSVITKTTEAITYVRSMNHTKTQKLVPIKIVEAVYLLLLMYSEYVTAVQARKQKCFKVSHGPKTPLVAYAVYFVLICTCVWLMVDRCACFWHLPEKKILRLSLPPETIIVLDAPFGCRGGKKIVGV